MISDPPKGQRDGPPKDTDPGDSHTGEGLASVRPRLARTLADAALRTQERQMEAMSSGVPAEPAPEADAALPPRP